MAIRVVESVLVLPYEGIFIVVDKIFATGIEEMIERFLTQNNDDHNDDGKKNKEKRWYTTEQKVLVDLVK